MADASAADRFWAFSLELYDRPGVAPACLALQDRCGLDVNLLLLCCWTAAEGRRTLPEPALRALIAAAAPWQDTVLRPLRAARRGLKVGVAGVPEADSDALRRRVAALELEAERIEQRLLAAGLPAPEAAEAGDPARVAAANLRLYLALRDVEPGSAERTALATILTAAFPAADPAAVSFAAAG